MKNLLISLTEYKAKKNQLDALKAELDAMKAELINYMNEKETDVLVCGAYKATLTHCVKTSLDDKAIREAFPDIAKQFERSTPFDRFTVK